MLLLAMQRDGGRTLMRQDVADWIGKIGTGWSTGIRDFEIPDSLASAMELTELDGMTAIKENW